MLTPDTRSAIGDGDQCFDIAYSLDCNVSIELIARTLSRINRYNGHGKHPISVLDHSLIVSRLCPPEFALAGLMHDAHEALIGDITQPVKNFLRASGCGHVLRYLDLSGMHAICRNFNLNMNDLTHDVVKGWDIKALQIESHFIFEDNDDLWRSFRAKTVTEDEECIYSMSLNSKPEDFINEYKKILSIH